MALPSFNTKKDFLLCLCNVALVQTTINLRESQKESENGKTESSHSGGKLSSCWLLNTINGVSIFCLLNRQGMPIL